MHLYAHGYAYCTYGRTIQVGSHTKQRFVCTFCIQNTILYDLRGVQVTQNQVLYALFVYKLQFCVTSFLYSACVHTVRAAMCEQGYAPVRTCTYTCAPTCAQCVQLAAAVAVCN